MSGRLVPLEHVMTRVLWISMIALGLSLGGCGGDNEKYYMPDPDAAVGGGEPRLVESAASRTDEEPTASGRKPEEGPEILEVALAPDPPVATGPFQVVPTVDNPAPGPLDLTYEWYVNGKEVLGIWDDSLPQEKFACGDVIEVSILARD